MTPFVSQIEAFGSTFLKMSLQASFLILALLLLRWLLGRRLSARLRYSLWILVWIKLSLPWLPESTTSVYGVWDMRLFSAESNRIGVMDDHLSAKPEIGNHRRIIPAQESAYVVPITFHPSFDVGSKVNTNKASEGQTIGGISLVQVVTLSWLLGISFVGGVMVWNMVTLHRRIGALSHPMPSGLEEIFHRCQKERGISQMVPLIVTGAVESPALCGLIRPVVLLPKDVMDRYSITELRLVMIHELEHLVRRDHWLNAWTGVILALHWLNPFVWFAVNKMRSDREFAVDEAVLKRSDADAETYGESILKAMGRASVRKIQPSLIGILEDKKTLKERFERIAFFNAKEKEGKGIWGFVVLLLVFGFLCRPVQSKELKEQDPVHGLSEQSEIMISRQSSRIENQEKTHSSKLLKTTKADRIKQNLNEIMLEEVHFVNEPFASVYRWLWEECGFGTDRMERAHFLIMGSKNVITTDQIMESRLSIDPPLYDVSAWDVFQHLVKVSSVPIKLQFEDYGLLICHDISQEIVDLEVRTYKLPSEEVIVQKAYEILTIQEGEILNSADALLKIFKAAGLPFVDQSDEIQRENERAVQSLFYPISDPPSNSFSNPPTTNGRSLAYMSTSAVLMVRATSHELNLVDTIVDALAYVPVQVEMKVTCGVLSRVVKKDNERHVFLRPLGKEVVEKSSTRSFMNNQFIFSPDQTASYLDAVQSIQGVELRSAPSITTISLRSVSLNIPLEKEENQAPQFFAAGPASMKVQVYPAVNELEDSNHELVAGVQAILPELNHKGQLVMVPDGSQFPEMNGGGIIPKGHTLLVHYARRTKKGAPWENTNEEWLQEFVIMVTPRLIDPAGNPID